MSFLHRIKTPKGSQYVRAFFAFFYLVGLAGIYYPPTSEFMIATTPLALLLSMLALAYFHENAWDKKTIWTLIVIFLAGYSIEVLGVQSGLIFGSYSYGSTLGFKLWDTPLMIGMNWVLMVYLSASALYRIRLNPWFKALLSTLLMLLYDIALEPVAPHLDMWCWSGEHAPLQNFIAWGVLAFLFQSMLVLRKIELKNPLAITLFLCQFIFFLVLNFI
jgi:putative membrane protein